MTENEEHAGRLYTPILKRTVPRPSALSGPYVHTHHTHMGFRTPTHACCRPSHQAKAAAEFLYKTAKAEGLDPATYYAAVYSSPLKRANQTATIIAEKLGAKPVTIVEGVREWNLGVCVRVCVLGRGNVLC